MNAEVARDLQQALFRLGRRMNALRVGREAGLDKAGYVTLARLVEVGDLRISELAGLVGLDLSTVSRQVSALEGSGHLRRTPDPDDRRACRIGITAAGVAAVERVQQEVRERLGEALAHWSPADLAAATALLGRLAADLHPDAAPAPETDHPRRTATTAKEPA